MKKQTIFTVGFIDNLLHFMCFSINIGHKLTFYHFVLYFASHIFFGIFTGCCRFLCISNLNCSHKNPRTSCFTNSLAGCFCVSHVHCPQALYQKIIANTNEIVALMHSIHWIHTVNYAVLVICLVMMIFALNMNTFHDDWSVIHSFIQCKYAFMTHVMWHIVRSFSTILHLSSHLHHTVIN